MTKKAELEKIESKKNSSIITIISLNLYKTRKKVFGFWLIHESLYNIGKKTQ